MVKHQVLAFPVFSPLYADVNMMQKYIWFSHLEADATALVEQYMVHQRLQQGKVSRITTDFIGLYLSSYTVYRHCQVLHTPDFETKLVTGFCVLW